jgi:DNA-binding Lrp family transcriptional regulator
MTNKIIKLLKDNPNGLSLNKIAETLSISKYKTTTLIEKLINKKIVREIKKPIHSVIVIYKLKKG